MLKRVALLGSIAAITALSVSSAGAQYWGAGPVTVTVSTYPHPAYPTYQTYPSYPAYRHYYHREGWWWDGDGPHYRSYRPPPFFYGDNFTPYGYGYHAESSYRAETGYDAGFGFGYDD